MRYRTLILMIVACMSGIFSAAAETSEDEVIITKPYFEWRLGCDISCPGDVSSGMASVKMFTHGLGVEFGCVYHYPFVANFYLEPGFKVYYDAYSVNEDVAHMARADKSIKNWSIFKYGMRIPVMVGYRFHVNQKVGVYVFTGPELEIGLTAYERIKRIVSIGDMDFHTGVSTSDIYADDNGLNRINALWTIGAGVSYRKAFFGLSGSLGMLNMSKVSGTKFHENRVTVGVGYNF